MAINDRPDTRCGNWWQHRDTEPEPADSLVNDPRDPADVYRPRCRSCRERLRDIELDAPWVVVYLDPTRQRRPGTVDDVLAALDHHGYAIVDRDD